MRLIYFAFLLMLPAPLLAQPDAPRSERRVAYTIDVTLDPEARTLLGRERITWRNPDRVPVGELQFHLYLNAFRDARSTFMQESGGRHRGYRPGDDAWGWIEVREMHLTKADSSAARDLTDRIRFIQPGGGNPDDRTVISVPLPEAVPPGGEITIELVFEARLPRIFARTGWMRKPEGTLFFMGAQWFPKLGVYEVPGQRYVPEDAPHGRWSTHTFHANSEFYADFGTYEVALTTPDDYVVGATGVRVAEEQEAGSRTVTYRAEDVHDFAWTANPDLLVYTDRWRDVELRLLLQPEHRAQARRHFDAARIALAYLDRWVGPYPYPTLTLVDAPGGSGGMEYPTLVTCGTVYGLPSWLRALEYVTIHEVGHQYFYGLLASNEAEEAWLDEGITSYLEARVMDAAYGPGAVLDFPGLRIGGTALHRVLYAEPQPAPGALFTRSWEYAYPGAYGRVTYHKSVVVLKTLEHLIGWDAMQEVLRTYYERWRFRHPTTRDFLAVVEEVAGEELDWFFDAYVYGTEVVDYAVAEVRSRPQGGDRYRSTVVVQRNEGGGFPQRLRVRFADGHTAERRWDGGETRRVFSFVHPAPAVEAYLDPENEVLLDINRLNNRRVTTPDDTLALKEGLKFTTRLQQLLYLASALF